MSDKFRAIVYIDGFNLYYGIKRMYQDPNTAYDPIRWREALWLDLVSLSKSLLMPTQELVQVNYFTARVTKPEDKRKRQSAYLEALGTLDKLKIIEGKYQYNEQTCWNCHSTFPNPKEKQTDVNLATALLVDTIEDRFDTGYLISGDGDYKAPLEYIRSKFPNKRVIAEFVETNFSHIVSSLCFKTYQIKRDRLLGSQMPDAVKLKNGFTVFRPDKWK